MGDPLEEASLALRLVDEESRLEEEALDLRFAGDFAWVFLRNSAIASTVK